MRIKNFSRMQKMFFVHNRALMQPTDFVQNCLTLAVSFDLLIVKN